MRHLVMVIIAYAICLHLNVAQAQQRRLPSNASAARAGTMMLSGGLGFFSSSLGWVSDSDNAMTSNLSGFYGVGGDFDFFLDSDVSAGAILRYYNTTDTVAKVEYTNTLMTIGGVFRGYLVDTNHWSLVGTTGAGLVDASVKRASTNVSSGMGIGLYFGMGIFYKLNRTIMVGVENFRVLGLGDKLNGWVLSDYMVKASFTL